MRWFFPCALGALVVLSADRSDAHSVPRLYLSGGPAVGFEPARRVPLVGGSIMSGIGLDSDDAFALEGTLLSSPFDFGAKVPPPDAFMWGALLLSHRRYFAPTSSALCPFTVVSFGGGFTLQGAVVHGSLASLGPHRQAGRLRLPCMFCRRSPLRARWGFAFLAFSLWPRRARIRHPFRPRR